jgi:hypothetical protein
MLTPDELMTTLLPPTISVNIVPASITTCIPPFK